MSITTSTNGFCLQVTFDSDRQTAEPIGVPLARIDPNSLPSTPRSPKQAPLVHMFELEPEPEPEPEQAADQQLFFPLPLTGLESRSPRLRNLQSAEDLSAFKAMLKHGVYDQTCDNNTQYLEILGFKHVTELYRSPKGSTIHIFSKGNFQVVCKDYEDELAFSHSGVYDLEGEPRGLKLLDGLKESDYVEKCIGYLVVEGTHRARRLVSSLDKARTLENARIVGIVTEYHPESVDLISLIDANQHKPHIKLIAQRVLTGLSNLHAQGVIHCDIKPDNILYNPKTNSLQIIDFESSISQQLTDKKLMAIYSTPEYQAFELNEDLIEHFESEDFGPEVDIWSFGVMLYGLMNGGNLPNCLNNPLQFIENGQPFSEQEKEKGGLVLEGNAMDFFNSIFHLNPAERPTADALLQHPFITS